MFVGDNNEDEDSLFGSPPPSPRLTGRPVSPALALPPRGTSCQNGDLSRSSASMSASASIQNVGTIALPGSHLDSELPINPLALSLDHGVVHRPPALPQTQMAVPPTRRTDGDVPVNAFRASILGTGNVALPKSKTRSTVGKNKKRTRSSTSTSTSDNEISTTRGMEFALPDPSAPPPLHYLRNQENLLGKAGLVGGVKPAAICHTRGSTSSNPILVDDAATPVIGRQQRAKARESIQPFIDSSKLTAPTNKEIVSVLVGQKDIFPVLESILKLLVKGTVQPSTVHASTGFQRSQSVHHPEHSTASKQPVKKRKLNRVPAGASDWDVPYPFPEGEGPAAYGQTWERERGKQLVAELVKLIEIAARKAATKKYLSEQEEMRCRSNGKETKSDARVNGHYRLETTTYGLDGEQGDAGKKQEDEVLKDSSNASHPAIFPSDASQHSPAILPPSTGAATTSFDLTSSTDGFDHLFSSLVAASSNQEQNILGITADSQWCSSSTQPIQDQTPFAVPEGVDQNMFDTWMSFLDAFPVPFSNSASQSPDFSSATSPATTTTPSLRSTPGLEDLNSSAAIPNSTSSNDLEAMLTSILNQPAAVAACSGASHQPPSSYHPLDYNPVTHAPSSLIGDHMIDPQLLALSQVVMPNTFPAMNIGMGSMSSLDTMGMNLETRQSTSPITSTSSFAGTSDPLTPVSANWDSSMPDVFMASDGGIGDDGQGMWRSSLWAGFEVTNQQVAGIGRVDMMDVDGMNGGYGTLPDAVGDDAARLDKGKGKVMEPAYGQQLPSTTAFQLGVKHNDDLFNSITQPAHAATTLTESTCVPAQAKKSRAKANSAPSARQQRKADILKRAHERRHHIQEELNMVKQQLWETTIEQAALIHLTRKLDEDAGKEAYPL